MSNATRQQLGLQSEKLRNVNKNEQLPSYDLYIGQEAMYQYAKSKQWFPATITRLGVESGSYNITTRECVTYRKIQAHLKPYQLQSKKSEDEHSVIQSSDKWTLKQADHKNFDSMNNQVQPYFRSKRDIKPPV